MFSRSLENQLLSTWNSYTTFAVNWALNWSTDLLRRCRVRRSSDTVPDKDTVFILPFFIINCLKLRKRQKIALCGVFSLGLITIAISLARFIVYTVTNYGVDDASGSKLLPLFFNTPIVHFSNVSQTYGAQPKCVLPPSSFRCPPSRSSSYALAHRTHPIAATTAT